jgi:hypothetical protein
LTVEECGDGDFVAADFFADGFEGQVLLLLGFEEGWGGGREAGDQVFLYGDKYL